MEIKYCEDCKWSKKKLFDSWSFAKCTNPELQISFGDEFVSRKLKPYVRCASGSRLQLGGCGPEGEHWEAK